MKRTLMTMLVALAAVLMMNSRAAQAPVCAPDDFDEALELLGAKTPEQKLDMTITILNNAYENMGDYIKVLKDDYNNKVVMLIDGDNLGVDVSDMTSGMTDLMKGVFMSTLFDDDEDGAISALFNVIINTGRSLEVSIYNDKDIDNAARLIYTPSEMRRAIEEHASGGSSRDGSVMPLVDDGLNFADDEDPETMLKKVVDAMEEYMPYNFGSDAHIWLDSNAKRVVMTMTSEDFAEMNEYRDMMYLFKPVFLQSLTEDDSNLIFVGLLVQAGYGLQVQLRAPGDEDNPIVLDYTPDELMDALGDE